MKKGWIVPVALGAAIVGGVVTYAGLMIANPEVAKFQSALGKLETRYVEPVERSTLVDGAIAGMMEALQDPYSSYMDQEASQSFYENISSSFEGIGAQVEERDGAIVIVAPIQGSPAEEAGLKSGDRIVRVGEMSVEGMDVMEAVQLIRGEKGTTVELTIVRGGESAETTLKIVRDTIPLMTVYDELIEDKIGHIRISHMSETTADEFKETVQSLLDQGMEQAVLDLRQNPGGLLDVTVQLAGMMLPDGETVLQVEDRNGNRQIYKAEHEDIGLGDMPIVVLIDKGSASASEILAGALQEAADVKLIGERTFGKGTVQTTEGLGDGSSMKYTIAKWLTPDGNWIHEQGITPTTEVSLPAYAELPWLDPETEWSEGRKAPEVSALQRMLEALGYSPGSTDGDFDAQTKAAVVRFQEDEGLEPSGIVSGETTRALIDALRLLIEENDTQLKAAIEAVKRQ